MTIDSAVGTSSATKIVVTVDNVASSITADDLIEIINAVVFAFEFSASTAQDALKQVYNSKSPSRESRFRESIRVRRMGYGSPVQIVIDLKPVIDFLTNGGYLIFLGVLAKIFVDGTTSWKNLQEVTNTRRKNKLLRDRMKRARNANTRILAEPTGEELRRLAEEEKAAMLKLLEPLVREVLTDMPTEMEVRGSQRVLIEAEGFVVRNINAAARAAEALEDKNVSYKLE
ncbi:hypothetical protein E3T61_13845 [Cryobacterium lactosi]|uniref:Uncharacterized protein n=1 Tax=Cryobacterium lactosi TaxID=1259202 RepID=A0A4R9BLG2_9MICO|nr:hypothetical protein [Cryobacterium lactosi]TFD86953.1 hypothetical protein E3T61_13845 [Cryobacterium lactosi]